MPSYHFHNGAWGGTCGQKQDIRRKCIPHGLLGKGYLHALKSYLSTLKPEAVFHLVGPVGATIKGKSSGNGGKMQPI